MSTPASLIGTGCESRQLGPTGLPLRRQAALELRDPGETLSEWVVGNDGPAMTHDPDRMRGLRGYHGSVSRTKAPLLPFEYQDELPLNNVPDLFLRVLMLMEISSRGFDVPMGERHVLGVEEAARPTRKWGTFQHLGLSHQRHRSLPCGCALTTLRPKDRS
jgi:hypothetical protein